MTSLIVIEFPNMEDAEKARAGLKSLAGQGLASIEDSAVIVKDAEGNVKVQNQASKGSLGGAFVGGALGLLLSGFFPLAGIAIGAAGGALIGRSLRDHVDKKFVADVTEGLAPGTSALFVLGKGEADAVVAALRPFEGTLYHTNLGPDAEQQLRDALK